MVPKSVNSLLTRDAGAISFQKETDVAAALPCRQRRRPTEVVASSVDKDLKIEFTHTSSTDGLLLLQQEFSPGGRIARMHDANTKYLSGYTRTLNTDEKFGNNKYGLDGGNPMAHETVSSQLIL
jgi:hypothetical protein